MSPFTIDNTDMVGVLIIKKRFPATSDSEYNSHWYHCHDYGSTMHSTGTFVIPESDNGASSSDDTREGWATSLVGFR